MFYFIYKNSIPATIVSILSACFVFGGVAIALEGEIAVAVVFIPLGVGLHFLAKKIAANKEAKLQAKKVDELKAYAGKNGLSSSSGASTVTKSAQPNFQPAPESAYGNAYCSNCGKKLAQGSSFCMYCGCRVKS